MLEIRRIHMTAHQQIMAFIDQCLPNPQREHLKQYLTWRLTPRVRNNDYFGVFLEEEATERLVSFIHIEHRTIAYGRATLKVAIIRHLSTLPDYRRQGYASSLLRQALAMLAETGVHLAMMYDATGYYEQYGFHPIIPEYQMCFERADALAMPEPRQTQPIQHVETLDREQIRQIKELYQTYWGGRVSISRDYDHWTWHYPLYLDTMRLVGQDEVLGYLSRNTHRQQTEVVASTHATTHALLKYDAQHSQDSLIVWHVPPDDAVVSYAQALLPIELRVRYRPSGGWVGRIIDASTLLKTLSPEIRTQGHHAPQPIESLKMQAEPHAVTLIWGDARDPVTISHQDFVALLFGVASPVTLSHLSRLSPTDEQALNALFPRRIAAIAPWDA